MIRTQARRVWRWLRDVAVALRRRLFAIRATEPGGAPLDESDPLADGPDELWAYFREAPALACAELDINPLTEDASRAYSRAIHRFDLGKRLGLIALDDANDSNPYCLVTKGLMRGAVLHLCHDDRTSICYASLAEFRSILAEARDRGLSIDELPEPPLAPCADQRALSELLVALSAQDREIAAEQLCLYIPLLDPQRVQDVERLAGYRDLYVREEVAKLLERRPRRELEHVAQCLAAEGMPQIAQPALRALERIRRLGAK